MNEDAIADLKQFITSTVSQQLALQTSEIRDEIKKLDEKIDKVDLKLSKKIDDLSEAVGDAMHAGDEATSAQLKDHETRITRLETKAA